MDARASSPLGITASLAAAVLFVLAACTVTTDSECGGLAQCPEPAKEMYYKETPGLEPWAAAQDGSLPDNWRDLADHDLESVGLTPEFLEVTTIATPDGRVFALQLRVPDDQRPAAIRHCFVANPRDSTPLASARNDCEPFYSTKP